MNLFYIICFIIFSSCSKRNIKKTLDYFQEIYIKYEYFQRTICVPSKQQQKMYNFTMIFLGVFVCLLIVVVKMANIDSYNNL